MRINFIIERTRKYIVRGVIVLSRLWTINQNGQFFPKDKNHSDDLVRSKSKEHGYIRILMSQIYKLAQLDKHQVGMAEVPSSILTAGNILLLIVLFSCSKSTEADIANFF